MRRAPAMEIVRMAADAIRAYRLRSALTILGVLIGVASLVGMTSLVRGFDEALRDTIRTIGPDTIFVTQFSGLSLSSGDDLFELMQRPSLTPDDAKAIARQAPSIASVNLVLGEGGPPTRAQLQHGRRRTKAVGCGARRLSTERGPPKNPPPALRLAPVRRLRTQGLRQPQGARQRRILAVSTSAE